MEEKSSRDGAPIVGYHIGYEWMRIVAQWEHFGKFSQGKSYCSKWYVIIICDYVNRVLNNISSENVMWIVLVDCYIEIKLENLCDWLTSDKVKAIVWTHHGGYTLVNMVLLCYMLVFFEVICSLHHSG